MIYVYFVESC